MRTDPVTDTIQFLLGVQPDQTALGWGQPVMVVLFALLLLASAAIAAVTWRRDPAQRSGAALWTWLFRVLIGAMWFQGSLWKLPLPDAGGLTYWTEQMAKDAAYPFFAQIVSGVMLPHMTVVDPLVFAAELGMAVSFLLGLFVRPVAVLGALYTLALWIGLYRNGGEWPWEYIFLAVLQAQFAVADAGRALGLDGLRRR